MQRADDEAYLGRFLSTDGEELFNFGGCSYLGLELRTELIEGTVAAVRKYGTQLSFSRAYMECPLYRELEQLLGRMTGGHVLATPTTTLGHAAALPTLIGPNDAVIVDRAAHASLHSALLLVKGARLSCADHNDLGQLEQQLEALSASCDKIWYVLDGLYSMHGDLAPFAQLEQLLARFPQLQLYIDDAHGTSWAGSHGRGLALEQLGGHPRVVVALSLNKAFSAAGGALVFADSETRDRVRRTGGPMVFSGPIQPPMLGAAVASAKLHLSDEFAGMQRALMERIALTNSLAASHGIELASVNDTPIFFVRCGSVETTLELVRSLRYSGLYTCPATFPAVSRDQGGVRFTISLHNHVADIELLMRSMAQSLDQLGLLAPKRFSSRRTELRSVPPAA